MNFKRSVCNVYIYLYFTSVQMKNLSFISYVQDFAFGENSFFIIIVFRSKPIRWIISRVSRTIAYKRALVK